MRHLIDHLSTFILPHQCVLCRSFADSTNLCASCWSGLEPISDPKCGQCGRPLQHDLPQGKCGHCWLLPPSIERTRAWCLYNDTSRAIVLKFKHGNGLALTPVLASMLGRLYEELVTADSLVIPVPLHRWRHLHRRYNQSAELARRLTSTHNCGLFAPNLLHRHKATTSQAGLNQAQRKQNLANAFQLNDNGKVAVRDRHILLIDDVLTTGATLNEATRTLGRAGCQSVSALVIARVR